MVGKIAPTIFANLAIIIIGANFFFEDKKIPILRISKPG